MRTGRAISGTSGIRIKVAMIMILLTALLLEACRSAPAVQKNYYLIESVDSVSGRDWKLSAALLEVVNVEVSPAYAGHKIAVREESNRIRYYDYHEWAVLPQLAIQDAVIANLSGTGMTAYAPPGFSGVRADFILRTTVSRMEMQDRGKEFHALLAIDFTVIDNRDRSIRIVHRAIREEKLKSKSMNLFADAISRMLAGECAALAQKIETIPDLVPKQ